MRCGEAHLLVFEPGEALGGQVEPEEVRAALHEAEVLDREPPAPDHLRARATA